MAGGFGLNIFLDKIFFIFHSIFVLFILTGWIWKKTRLIHLIAAGLVVCSWFILGIWFGIGYCPCTDWHWRVRQSLGYTDMSSSYVHFLITTLTGIEIREKTVDVLLVSCLAASVTVSMVLFVRDRMMKK